MKNTLLLLLLSLILFGCKSAEKVTIERGSVARPVMTPRGSTNEPITFSIVTEVTQLENGEERTIVFREAGDMTSTNCVKGKDLKDDDDAAKVKDKIKKKD